MTTIREKGYSHWDGTLAERRLPWWPITRMGILLTFRKKQFKFFFSLAFLPAVVFLAGIYISERLQDFKFMFKGSEQILNINPGFFKAYFTNDGLLFMMVLLLVFSGAGLISDDLKHNALQIYFSRPIGKKDYFLGKASVVVFFILLLTLVPGLVFILFKLIFAGNFKLLADYPWIGLSVISYSLLLMIFFSFYTLLLSALSKNRRYVTVLIFMVYILSDVLSGILSGIFRSPYVPLVSLKANLQQAGAVLFGQRLPYHFPGFLSFVVLGAFCLVAALVLDRRIRGVEVVR
jgi:ABC-type transport system involved in multi-copper enzyme maturation permease subunit